ncbi:hypothetical protein Verru16b_03528 [Lacunisphaera limnophila]|uniref:HhH-GPD domain-containing protein n=1 Tax=Lacunisphaera limnophila TaxID=1838286 RepID=A0A1D8AZV3_9BACT|nr:hypothetical protein Verru16b_03528 [Lacunisphaera limnophila]
MLTDCKDSLRWAADMETLVKARLVADYVAANWTIGAVARIQPTPASWNIAAILVDTIFQAGLNYRTVVLPRVIAVTNAFPEVASLVEFKQAMRTPKFAAALAWSHPEKPKRLRQLVGFLRLQGVDTLSELRGWVSASRNRVALLTVRGVGYKTVDYLCRLLGISAIAVDRHAQELLRLAGVGAHGYLEARRILEFAADLLLLNRWTFDRVMWQTMSVRAG